MEKVLNYSRSIVTQDTYYWCGPATMQNILNSRGVSASETELARSLGTTINGTNHIGLLTNALNARTGGKYVTVQMPNDPPSVAQSNRMWNDIRSSVLAGYGVGINIVAPPSNYPRGVNGSMSPRYGGGTVYHYIAAMGFNDEKRCIWIADSGFSPYGYWISADQLATLTPPKGYTYATVEAKPTPTPAPALGSMTAAALAEAMGCSLSRARQMLEPFIDAMVAAQINTPLRAAHWCAQIGHESAGLVYMEEIASGAAYEGRADLGNTQSGDGRRFKGSGPIQLTGRHNFTKFSEWCYSKRYVTNPREFVDHPERVRNEPRWGFLAASWYWTVARPQLNSLADADDLVGVTRAINGGTNGLDDRRSRLARCKKLGSKLLPPTGGLTVDASAELTKRFPSRSKYRAGDGPVDTLAGFVLNIDARIHEDFVERNARLGDEWCLAMVKREADRGDVAAKSVLDSIEGAA